MEEARLQAAAADRATAVSAKQSSTPDTLHHTTVPRLLVSISPVFVIVGLVLLVTLKQRGYITETTSVSSGGTATSYHLDPSKTMVATLGAICLLVLPLVAWGWWVVTATLNAQLKSRNAGWPWTLPMSVTVAVTALVAANFAPPGPQALLQFIFVVAYVWGAYGVLFGLRKSARAIKAAPQPWTRLLWLPRLGWGVAVMFVAIGAATGSTVISVFGALLPFGVFAWTWVTLCTAMAVFDRSCRAVEVARGDMPTLPAFMTGSWSAR